jgi:hypothetical protein
LDPAKITLLKEQKLSLHTQQISLEAKMPKQACVEFFATHPDLLESSFPVQAEEVQVTTIHLALQGLINAGKRAHDQVQHLLLQRKQSDLAYQQSLALANQELTSQQDKLKDLQEQDARLAAKIQARDQEVAQEASFDCSQIGTNCPFIKVINKQHFLALDAQKQTLLQEQTTLTQKLQAQLALIQTSHEAIALRAQDTQHSTALAQMQAQEAQLQQLIEEIKNFLQTIDYAAVQALCTEYQTADQAIK